MLQCNSMSLFVCYTAVSCFVLCRFSIVQQQNLSVILHWPFRRIGRVYYWGYSYTVGSMYILLYSGLHVYYSDHIGPFLHGDSAYYIEHIRVLKCERV